MSREYDLYLKNHRDNVAKGFRWMREMKDGVQEEQKREKTNRLQFRKNHIFRQ